MPVGPEVSILGGSRGIKTMSRRYPAYRHTCLRDCHLDRKAYRGQPLASLLKLRKLRKLLQLLFRASPHPGFSPK
jgi:hypothetical protein